MPDFKKNRPYNGFRIRETLGEINKTIKKEMVETGNNQRQLLEAIGNQIENTKEHLKPFTNTKTKDELFNIANNLKNTLNNDIDKIDKLFDHFKNEEDNSTILLSKEQSLIRKHIKNNPLIEKELSKKFDNIGFKEFLNDIIMTDWIEIGKPDERGNRIAKEGGRHYYINSVNKIIIERKREIDIHKYAITTHNGTVGGCPYDIYNIDGEIIINRIETCKKESEFEYYVSVGPWDRKEKDFPMYTPSKITKTLDDGNIVTFYIDKSPQWSSSNGELKEIDKSKYIERDHKTLL